jgi:choice-of-anchor A domain-containing protein
MAFSIRKWAPIASCAVALFLTAGQSQTLAAGLGDASQYNVFVFGNDSQQNVDAWGAVAVGGNASFSSYAVGSQLNSSYNSTNTLVVGGNLSFNNGSVAYGNTVVGGSATGSGTTYYNLQQNTPSPISFASDKSTLLNNSAQWASLSQNGNVVVTPTYGSNANLTLNCTQSGLNVFNLTSAQLQNCTGLTINGGSYSGATILINVNSSGTSNSVSLSNFQTTTNGTDANHILYNFSGTQTLTTTAFSWVGSVLASSANVEFDNGHIDGTLIANNLNGNGEAHSYQFLGSIPAGGGGGASNTPEPGAVAFAVAGLTPLMMKLRRRVSKH